MVRFIGESVCGKNASVAVHLYLHSSVKLKITSETGEEKKKGNSKSCINYLLVNICSVCVCVCLCVGVYLFSPVWQLCQLWLSVLSDW